MDFTTGPLPKITYRDRNGQVISMLNKALKRIIYSQSTELGIYNLANRIQYPIQLDSNKFQRINCWAITDCTFWV